MDRRTPTSSVNKSKNLHRHAPKHRQSRILAAEVVAYVCVVVIVGYSAATVVVASPLNSLNVNVHQGRLRQTRIRKTSRIQEQNINHFPTTNLLGFRQRLSSPSDASEANYSYASIAGIGGFLGRQFGRNNRRFLGWALVGTTTVATIQNICSSKPVRRAAYFWWNAGPIVFHYKFTKWWLTKTNAPIEKRDAVYNNLHNRYCEQSMRIALHLKGLYVKIAQIVSSRPDFVPPVYIDLFVQCQDSLPQWPIEDIRKIIDETLRTNYNLSIDDVFESIDPIALGSASIGQVHRATIKDTAGCCYNTGTLSLPSSPVTAVKVMHPGAEDMFRHDFSVFRWLCKVALTGWTPILDECYRQIMSEFDYRTEAQSLDTVRRCLSTSPFRRSVRIPEPVHSLCTKELLVMEMLEGKKLSDSLEDELTTALGGDPDVAQTFLRRKRLELILGSENLNKLDIASNDVGSLSTRSKIRLLRLYRRASKIIDLLVNVQGYSILSSGIFNGDPHVSGSGGVRLYVKRRTQCGYHRHLSIHFPRVPSYLC